MGYRRVLLGGWLGLAVLSLSGCNAGVGGVLLAVLLQDDDDDDGGLDVGSQGVSTLEFLGLENARTRPAETVVRFRLINPTGDSSRLLIEYNDLDAGTGFRPATLAPPLPGEPGQPGELVDVPGSAAGRIHRVGWNARRDLATDRLRNVRLRFSADLADVVLADVVVGNDAPEVLELAVRQRPAEPAEVTVDLKDTSGDPVDLTVEFAAPSQVSGEAPVFQPATTEGRLEFLESSPDGLEQTFLWDSITDLGPVDRPAILRVTPMDRIDGGPGKTGQSRQRQIFSNGNRAPDGVLLEDEILTHPDARRGIPLAFTLADNESNAVDVILQWEDDAHPFPELPEGLERDPVAREETLTDPDERAAFQILTLVSERVVGPVEAAADGLALADNEVLVSWWLSRSPAGGALVDELLSGRALHVEAEDGETRRICGYAAETGVLSFDEPFSPPLQPGDSIAVTFGGALGTVRMRTAPDPVTHRVVWDASVDAPGGGTFRFRLTPYDRVATDVDDPCGELFQTDDSQVFRGAVGTASTTGGAKRTRGPFGVDGAWAIELPPVDTPVAIDVADVDGDGSLDIVYAAELSNVIVVLRQTVPGEFEELRLLDEALAGPAGLAVEDLDGDGDIDLSVIGEDSGTLRVLLQEPGLDFFTNRRLLATGDLLGRPTALAAADFNADGIADLAVTNAEGELHGVAVFVRNDAGWDPPRRAALGPELQPLSLDASDVDGDGQVDLAVGGLGFVAVCLQDPDGSFTEGVFSVDAPGAELGAVSVADINLDGNADVLVVDRENGAVLAALQSGDGDFTLTPLAEEEELQGPSDIVSADFNGDGRTDFAVADAGNSTRAVGGDVSVFLAGGEDEFQRDILRRVPQAGEEAPSPQAVLAVDLDGDGRLELISAEARVQEIAVYFQAAKGSFRDEAEEVVGPPLLSTPSSLAVVDLNADGRRDLVVTHPAGGGATYLRQGIGGQFVALGVPGSDESSGAVDVAVGDVDGDGFADLAIAERDTDSIAVLSGEGFSEGNATTMGATGLLGPISVALGDLDGNGQLDLVAGGQQGGVRWFRQVAGEAGERPQFEAADAGALALPAGLTSERARVAVGDWDRDGLPDVVATYGVAERLAVFLQSPVEAGSFVEPILVELPAGSDPGSLALADLDGNGLLDALVSGRGDGAVYVVRQEESGAGAAEPLVAPGEFAATDAVVGDADGDGVLDVAAGLVGPERSFVRLLFQGSEGGFSDTAQRDLESALVLGPASLVLEDLDVDGEADVSSANSVSGNVTVYYGGR